MAFKLALTLACILVAMSCAQAGSISERIIGGQAAYEGQFPHQVSLQYIYGGHLCGGSIIASRYVLTAAQCVHWRKPSDLKVLVGTINRFSGGYFVKVYHFIAHADYGNFMHDIALVKLYEDLSWSNTVRPIPLATREPPVGATIQFSGWGLTKNNDEYNSEILQFNSAKFLSRQDCIDSLKMPSPTVICLGKNEGNGMCRGDSGGPAIYNGELIGIASYVNYVCGSAVPDGFANVPNFISWIKDNMD